MPRYGFEMIRKALLAAGAALILPTIVHATPADPATVQKAALEDDVALDITEGLTTEVGPRLAGTDAEARARDWSVAKLKALGFSNVHIEEYRMPVWVRGEEQASITAPFPAHMAVTALGNSGATGAKGIEADVVYFPTFADFQAAPDSAVKGKIAFVSHAMKAAQDGSGYGAFGQARRIGPNLAAKKGAAAIVIRSIGTDSHRLPHTGVTMFEKDVTPIPAAALSVPDAENLERILARGKPVRMKLLLTPRFVGEKISGNVIAEVPGSDPAAGLVVGACHLDSWDLGTGAIDDASGCAIVAAAAKQVMAAGQPRRTIRLLWAGAEEVGGFGGDAYFESHKNEAHALAMESDSGADRVWQIAYRMPDALKPLALRINTALEPLGIPPTMEQAHGGADVGRLLASGVNGIDLRQDATRYFDLHHTADDTFDKIDPVQLRQNVAAWSTVFSVAANTQDDLLHK